MNIVFAPPTLFVSRTTAGSLRKPARANWGVFRMKPPYRQPSDFVASLLIERQHGAIPENVLCWLAKGTSRAVAARAQSNEIFSGIISQPAARAEVVDLKISRSAAVLAAPAIARQYFAGEPGDTLRVQAVIAAASACLRANLFLMTSINRCLCAHELVLAFTATLNLQILVSNFGRGAQRRGLTREWELHMLPVFSHPMLLGSQLSPSPARRDAHR